MRERIAIVDGLRTPIAKAGSTLKNLQADSLGATVVREIVLRSQLSFEDFDEVIIGNVAQPSHATNVSRVIAMRAGFHKKISAFTVNRNCASGMESITNATNKILAGDGEIFLAGGVESMSNIPFLYSEKMKGFLTTLSSKRFQDKFQALASFKPSFLKPTIGLMSGLTDPISGMIMGTTAEVLGKKFHIDRPTQDKFAAESHNKAERAIREGKLKEEILPIVPVSKKGTIFSEDNGIRKGQSPEKLAKLKPFFDRHAGTVTAGNSSQISDGAGAVILMSESKVKEMGIEPLGYLRDFSYVGLEASEMGLGPVFATKKLFDKTGVKMTDIDLIELNEAFAVQVLANEIAFNSTNFAKEYLNGKKVGEMNMDILNVNGGSIAYGHPVGMSGTRLVIHTLKELRRRKKNLGLATLCIGGGQGASLLLEVE
ncbi:MAG: thiolase family protein [Campylobacterales bacterium]|nr:thiolase family protein [Campylobacterales bacterium]